MRRSRKPIPGPVARTGRCRIVALKPRQVVAGALYTDHLGLKVVTQGAFARLGVDLGGRSMGFVTSIVIDVDPAGPPVVAAQTISVSYRPSGKDEQPHLNI